MEQVGASCGGCASSCPILLVWFSGLTVAAPELEAPGPGTVLNASGNDRVMDSAEPSDAVVIAASLDDPEAFRIVFLRYHAAIHTYAARRAGADTADEVAAGVFEVAFAARRRYLTSEESARPWLFGIASRVLLRHARSERRQFAAYARAAETAIEDSTSDEAGRRIDARSLRAPLLAALVDLRTEDRDPLLLFAWGGLRYDEIAIALGVPVGTVRSRIHRGRLALRASLPPLPLEDARS